MSNDKHQKQKNAKDKLPDNSTEKLRKRLANAFLQGWVPERRVQELAREFNQYK